MINYPELPPFGQTRPRYKEGDVITHPSGNVYKRINGNWVLQK
jgi:hypothetical protein